jgi:phosphoglucosamine mutase
VTRVLFGTDGVRGAVGEFLSPELALALGRAAGRQISARPGRVLIIRDTRESGEMLQAAVAAGVCAAGCDVLLGGVLPTPAAPLLIRRYGLDLGVVISASHNPYQDNGIKFFAADGFKLSDEAELAIERDLQLGEPNGKSPRGLDDGVRRIGAIRDLRGACEDYLRELQSRFRELRLDGVEVLLDCANGATYEVAPEIFRRLGARVSVLAGEPDGRNINANCGSTHVQLLAERVREGSYALGFAFDGDGDRVLAVDGAGNVVDGDELIAIIAHHLKRSDRLGDGGVVVTVMSNFGFHTAMKQAGIPVASTNVGDRYVLEELRTRGWLLGGEQSGHIIDMSFNCSGDGIASALLVLEALDGRALEDRETFERLPQRLVGVQVRDRAALEQAEGLSKAVEAAQAKLRGCGRVLVRASGTEPLVRIMVEAPTDDQAREICSDLAELVKRELA